MLFQLPETIAQYNRLNKKNIKSTQTWGLVYLQPKNLNFLNENTTQIQQAIQNPLPFPFHTLDQPEMDSPFQNHSNQSLYGSLLQIIYYAQHFEHAKKELQKNQIRWFPWKRLPTSIADAYDLFLTFHLNDLKTLQSLFIEILLERLHKMEQQQNVLYDEQPLTPHHLLHGAKLFNRLQRTIEDFGSPAQKNQLYQFSWYANNDEITTVEIISHRLLIPLELKHTIPKKVRKPRWLFSHAYEQFRFLERQQALFAQFALPIQDEDHFFLSNALRSLNRLMPRLCLLQHAIASIKSYSPPKFRWLWQKKPWQHTWQVWLENQFQKNQDELVDVLAQHVQTLQTNIHAGNLLRFQIHFQSLLKTINPWLKQSPSPEPLNALIQQFSTFLEKEIKAAQETERDNANKNHQALALYKASSHSTPWNCLQALLIKLVQDPKVRPTTKETRSFDAVSAKATIPTLAGLKPLLRSFVYTQNEVFSLLRSKQKEKQPEPIREPYLSCK